MADHRADRPADGGTTVVPAQGFYRQSLPEPSIPFSSEHGRRLFREALAAGGTEGFFALAEQFHTQSEPAFCGLGTLVIILNALSIDPGRRWKGPWRWYSEELLECCDSLDLVKESGSTFELFACLARCNGAIVEAHRGQDLALDEFRDLIERATRTVGEPHLVVSYSRELLGQTGDGHFSPVGGFHASTDLALIMDVARFKYPPHWVPIDILWKATRAVDGVTGGSRGVFLLGRSPDSQERFC